MILRNDRIANETNNKAGAGKTPLKQQAFVLQTLQKLSVRQIPLLKTRKITMQFQSMGKVESLRCFCSPKTFGMGLPNQEMQLQQLLETLNLWSTRSDFTE